MRKDWEGKAGERCGRSDRNSRRAARRPTTARDDTGDGHEDHAFSRRGGRRSSVSRGPHPSTAVVTSRRDLCRGSRPAARGVVERGGPSPRRGSGAGGGGSYLEDRGRAAGRWASSVVAQPMRAGLPSHTPGGGGGGAT
jgi:hypothetical protein